MKRVLAIIVAFVSIWVSLPFETSANDEIANNMTAVSELHTDDTFYLGSYPQTLVTDTKLITALNRLNITMQSYNYLVNTTEDVGMTYGDVLYEGIRYRKVFIGNTYRPRSLTDARNSGSVVNDHINSVYKKSSSYWFVWEPVQWEVINHSEQGVIAFSKLLLDAQPFHNTATTVVNWQNSDLRSWMNSTMLSMLFSESEKTKLLVTDVTNPGNLGNGDYTGYTDNTSDYLWLLDISEITDENGFGQKSVPAEGGGIRRIRTKLFANGTDYGFCQGLIQGGSYSFSGCNYLTRTMSTNNGNQQYRVCNIIENATFGYARSAGINYTLGIRACVTLDKDALVSMIADIDEEQPCAHPNTLTRVTKPASFQLNGIRQTVCAGCGEVLGTERINAVESIRLTKKALLYNNTEQIAPPVQITDSEGAVIAPENYTLTCISRANGKESDTVKDIGQYKLRVTFHNEYSGSRDLYFSVKPQKTKITSASFGDKGCTVVWKADAAVTGYEVELSATNGFSQSVLHYTMDNNRCNTHCFRMPYLLVTNLKGAGNRRCYARIRTYKIIQCDGGEAYMYSPWSAPYTITKKLIKK